MNVFLPGPGDHLIFNVDAPVGPGTGSTEDILLVQFLIRKVAEKRLNAHPALKARMLKVPLSGVADAATVDGIKAAQEYLKAEPGYGGTVVDGRVSPARGISYGGGVWTICVLNNTVRDLYPELWPRLQDFDGCPVAVGAKAQKIL